MKPMLRDGCWAVGSHCCPRSSVFGEQVDSPKGVRPPAGDERRARRVRDTSLGASSGKSSAGRTRDRSLHGRRRRTGQGRTWPGRAEDPDGLHVHGANLFRRTQDRVRLTASQITLCMHAGTRARPRVPRLRRRLPGLLEVLNDTRGLRTQGEHGLHRRRVHTTGGVQARSSVTRITRSRCS